MILLFCTQLICNVGNALNASDTMLMHGACWLHFNADARNTDADLAVTD